MAMASGTEFVDLGTDDASVIGMKVTGKATAETISNLVERLEQIKGAGKKARLYIDLTAYEGYDLGMVKEKLAHIVTLWSGIERCAYVVDKAWMATMIGLVDAVTPMHLRAFGSDHDAEARAWVLSGEEPAETAT
jgi:hypothetical protein